MLMYQNHVCWILYTHRKFFHRLMLCTWTIDVNNCKVFFNFSHNGIERCWNGVKMYSDEHTTLWVSFIAILLPAGKLTFSKYFSEHGVKKLGKWQIFFFDIKTVQMSWLTQSSKCYAMSTPDLFKVLRSLLHNHSGI